MQGATEWTEDETTPEENPTRPRVQINRWAVGVRVGLMVLAFVIYLGALDAELLYSWDDQRYITANPHFANGVTLDTIRAFWTDQYFASYIPITMMGYTIQYALWGEAPTGYFVVLMLLHGVNAILVYSLLMKLLDRRRWIALFAAILFVVHPIQVENVAWASELKALLGMLGFLITFHIHIYSHKAPWALPVGYAMHVITMLSKTSAIGAPLLFFLYDVEWSRRRGKEQRPLVQRIIQSALRAIPYGIISIIFAFVQIWAHDQVGGIKNPLVPGFLGRLQLMAVVNWEYFLSLVFPLNLNNMYFYTEQGIRSAYFAQFMGVLLVVGLSVLAWRGGRFGRMSAAWVVMFMLPVSNIVPIAIQRADRYMYFPVVVLFALFGLALTRIWNRRTELSRHAVTFTVGGVILACIVLTVARVEVWSNSGTLWADHRTDYPFTSTGILNEGVYYFRTGDFETAEYLMTRLVRLHPNQWKGYRILGNIAFSRNEFPEAVDFYNDMLRFVPPGENIGVQDNFGRSLVMVGLESHEDGDFITADFYYNAATEYIPTNPVLYNNLGFNYMQMGDLTAALTVLQRAIDLNPDYTTPYSNLLLIAQRTNNGELAAFAQQNLQRLGAAETP